MTEFVLYEEAALSVLGGLDTVATLEVMSQASLCFDVICYFLVFFHLISWMSHNCPFNVVFK